MIASSSAAIRAARLRDVCEAGAVAVVRLPRPDDVEAVVAALLAGGVRVVELTLTMPGAFEVLRALHEKHIPGLIVGAGSVLTTHAASAAIAAGASFVVSPVFDAQVLAAAHEASVPCLPGAYTPGELLAAQRSGAEVIKLFPADGLGVKYLASVLAPMPFLRIMPTGGVTPDNCGDWLRAGAAAVGLGNALVDPRLVEARDFESITARAATTARNVTSARHVA